MQVIDLQGIRSGKSIDAATVMVSNTVDTNSFKDFETLKTLRVEHRDLDSLIKRLTVDPTINQIEVKRLKKQKLNLKDRIAKLESALIPDLNA